MPLTYPFDRRASASHRPVVERRHTLRWIDRPSRQESIAHRSSNRQFRSIVYRTVEMVTERQGGVVAVRRGYAGPATPNRTPARRTVRRSRS